MNEKANHLFKGKLKKIRIDSERANDSVLSIEDMDIAQRLTIDANGKVYLTHKTSDEKTVQKEKFTILVERVMGIFEILEYCFTVEREMVMSNSTGYWSVTLTNDEGKEFRYGGAMVPLIDPGAFLDGISDEIRKLVGREDLLLFDGNPDRVVFICIDYVKKTKEETGSGLTMSGEQVEQLIISRELETMTYKVQINEETVATYNYHLDGGLSVLLDFFPTDYFCNVKGNPSDVIDDPTVERDYSISLRSKYGLEYKIVGSYDRDGLPRDWSKFVDEVKSFMFSFMRNDFFNSNIYRRPKRRISDLIICQVVFGKYSNEYSYLTDDDSLKEGDKVLVPLGPHNKETVAEIAGKGYYAKEDAPYPVDKIKKIIKKIEEA